MGKMYVDLSPKKTTPQPSLDDWTVVYKKNNIGDFDVHANKGRPLSDILDIRDNCTLQLSICNCDISPDLLTNIHAEAKLLDGSTGQEICIANNNVLTGRKATNFVANRGSMKFRFLRFFQKSLTQATDEYILQLIIYHLNPQTNSFTPLVIKNSNKFKIFDEQAPVQMYQ